MPGHDRIRLIDQVSEKHNQVKTFIKFMVEYKNVSVR